MQELAEPALINRLYEYSVGPSARSFLPGKITYTRQELYRQETSMTLMVAGSLQLKSGVSVLFSLEVRTRDNIRTITFRAGNMTDPLVLTTKTPTAPELNG